MESIFIILFSLRYWESITANFFPGLILTKPISVIFLSRFVSSKTNPGEFFSCSPLVINENRFIGHLFIFLCTRKFRCWWREKALSEERAIIKPDPDVHYLAITQETFMRILIIERSCSTKTISYSEWEVSLRKRARNIQRSELKRSRNTFQ